MANILVNLVFPINMVLRMQTDKDEQVELLTALNANFSVLGGTQT